MELTEVTKPSPPTSPVSPTSPISSPRRASPPSPTSNRDIENQVMIVSTLDTYNNNPTNNPTYHILKKIHTNCANYSIYHNKRYQIYKNLSCLAFRIPLIILSGFNSFFAVGIKDYLSQSTISISNSLISLFCGVITSLELFLNLQKRSEDELIIYKNYYTLCLDTYKFIEMTHFDETDPNKIEITNKAFEILYDRYKALSANSSGINIYKLNFKDELKMVDIKKIYKPKDTLDDCVTKWCLCFN